MKLKTVSLAMLAFLLLVLGRAGSAQEIQPLEPDWLRQMYAEGWEKLQEGVLKRDLGEGKSETFSYGAEGFQWLIDHYRQKLISFEDQYRESPTEELGSLIDQLTDKISDLQDGALGAPTAESFDESQIEDCPTFSLPTADATALTSAQGVTASASAEFQSTCEITGDTFTYAHAKAKIGTVLTDLEQFDDDSGTQIISQATASAEGSLECFSEASASVTVLDKTYLAEDTNSECPDAVSITGPTQVTTDYYGPACADVTWTAKTLSGRADYTFEWYIGTDLVGTGPTFTKRYCSQNVDVTLRVVARDDAGWSDDAPFDTKIKYLDRIIVSVSGPSTVNTDYYSSPCAAVTWTASATSSGHSGYTYKWSLGTDPTVQGTGSTFSKQYCNNSQAVIVKVIATASDGHSDSSNKTTTIVDNPQLTASVSGPASVTTDFYDPTCVNVTWTANVTGGHPGYTYKWYLGTGTTVQGTGTTFTKSLCNTDQSVTVKVVDSDGHTASKTSTTNVQYRRVIAATITGPTSVSSSTSCTTVSWTANATSNGHSGFIYKWYIGTTLQTTGTSFSKQFCSSGGTSQSVIVKVTATASDGHQDTDTHTTSITFGPPPLTASISGPSETFVTSPKYCTTITWTADVSGGTPPYSYSWTIGTSTTVLSTTSSLTKTYCTGRIVDVKLTVRDSASQNANATFTTWIEDMSQ